MAENKVSISKFEEQVLGVEGLTIRVWGEKTKEVLEYPYVRRAAGSISILELLKSRIWPCTGDLSVDVYDSKMGTPHRGTVLDNVR
jgi:hypothetical protein